MHPCFRPIYVAILAILVPVGMLPMTGAARADGPGYTVLETWHLPGAVRWDYLTFDPVGRRLFVTRGGSVDVLDVTTGKVIGSIPDTRGAHGVALTPDIGKGFVSDGAANTVTVFDLATLKTIATVPTGTKPDAIVYDTASRRVFAANGDSGDLTVIDAVTDGVIGTVALGGRPEFAAVDGKGRLYVNLEDISKVAVIDTVGLKVVATYDLGSVCNAPAGLAIDTTKNRLFSTCRNRVMAVVDATTGALQASLPIGASTDAAAYDPETGLAFSSNGDGTLTVIDASRPDHLTVVQTVPTMPTARTMALDPSTHRIWLAAAETDGFEAPTAERLHPRPHLKPGSFMILTVGAR